MASTDFQQLLAKLQSEFERLQQENVELKEELRRTSTSTRSVLPQQIPATPIDETSSRISRAVRDPASWKQVPDINPHSAIDITDVFVEVSQSFSEEAHEFIHLKSIPESTEQTYATRSEKEQHISTPEPQPAFRLKKRLGSTVGVLLNYSNTLHGLRNFGHPLRDTSSYRLCMAAFFILDCGMIMWSFHIDKAPLGFRVVTALVCIAFIIDGVSRACYIFLVSKSLHHGRDVFDALCLASMVFDQICLLVRGAIFKVSWTLIMQGFRLLRLFWALRYVVSPNGTSHLLREFDWLLSALLSASGWRTLFCVFFYFGLTFTIFSIALMDNGLFLECESFRVDDDILCEHFNTFQNTYLTLFKVTFGGILWGDMLDSLVKFSTFHALVFGVFLLSYAIILVNIGIGAILRVCQDSTDQQKFMDKLHTEAGKHEQEIRVMEQMFMEIDINDNGAISQAEFELALKDPHMTSTLSALKLDIFDLHAIFPLFDINGSGDISLDEFVLGCMRMKGQAKALDIVQLQASVQDLAEELAALKTMTRQKSQEKIVQAPGVGQDIGNTPRHSRIEHEIIHSSHSKLKEFKSRVLRQSTRPQQSIPKCEMRAMSLQELKRIPGLIEGALLEEHWIDMQTGLPLATEDVNLYHFNYYYMCAKTTPDGVILEGLDAAVYEVGDELVQRNPNQFDAAPIARGEVLERSSSGRVHITVIHGHFNTGDYSVQFGGKSCGTPSNLNAPGAISFKEHVSSEELKPRWFCSHWWGEKIVHFVKCCDEHARRRRLGKRDAAYWVCAYANRQYDISGEISDSPLTSSFCKAIDLAEGVLLFLDNKATPFTRIWCCFEIYLTITSGTKCLDIVTVREYEGNDIAILLSDGKLPCETQMAKTVRERHFPLRLLVHGMQADLTKGEATVQSDKENILKVIKSFDRISTQGSGEILEVNHANGALNAVFAQAAWIHALHKRVDLEDIDPPNRLSLPSILSRDTRCKIEFSFEMCAFVANADVLLLARGLSPFHKEIHLSFGNCKNLSDNAMRDLAEHLPEHVETCRLDFVGCSAITSEGLASLAQGLPPRISNLRLDFACCPEIDMDGVRYLAEHLPQGIKQFYATFLGTQVDRNFRSIGELRAVCNKPILNQAINKFGQLTGMHRPYT